MRVLLDTQCWLWINAEPERLSAAASTLIEEASQELFLSAVSSWEIAIKYSIGKLRLPLEPLELISEWLLETRTIPLPIDHSHALQTAKLPKHHSDPFDRLLIAQAQIERLPIMTADRAFSLYDVEVLPA